MLLAQGPLQCSDQLKQSWRHNDEVPCRALGVFLAHRSSFVPSRISVSFGCIIQNDIITAVLIGFHDDRFLEAMEAMTGDKNGNRRDL